MTGAKLSFDGLHFDPMHSAEAAQKRRLHFGCLRVRNHVSDIYEELKTDHITADRIFFLEHA